MSPETPASKAPADIELGKISGVFGIKGWVKVHSWTRPRENILDYPEWKLVQQGKTITVKVLAGREQGKTLIAQLEGVNNPEDARLLMNAQILVARDALPVEEEGSYYWADLIGLAVVNEQSQHLGVVKGLMETGANDVLLVSGDKEHLLPFVQGPYIKDVDLVKGVITVDWDPEF